MEAELEAVLDAVLEAESPWPGCSGQSGSVVLWFHSEEEDHADLTNCAEDARALSAAALPWSRVLPIRSVVLVRPCWMLLSGPVPC